MLNTANRASGLPSDHLDKKQVPTTIQTMTQRIVGNIHIREWERVKDAFNNLEERFIAFTDAKIYNFSGQIVHSCKFMAVNIDHVVWINPSDQISPDEPLPGEVGEKSME